MKNKIKNKKKNKNKYNIYGYKKVQNKKKIIVMYYMNKVKDNK